MRRTRRRTNKQPWRRKWIWRRPEKQQSNKRTTLHYKTKRVRLFKIYIKEWNDFFSWDKKEMISLVFLLQQMGRKTVVVRGCIMVKMDLTLLILLETKSSQSPEPLSPGPITMTTTGLQDTCPVSLGKVNPGCAECRAWRDTEGRGKTAVTQNHILYWELVFRCELWESYQHLFLCELNTVMLTSRIPFSWKGCITVCIFCFEATNL